LLSTFFEQVACTVATVNVPFLIHFDSSITGLFGLTMAQPNSPAVPPQPTKEVQLDINTD